MRKIILHKCDIIIIIIPTNFVYIVVNNFKTKYHQREKYHQKQLILGKIPPPPKTQLIWPNLAYFLPFRQN